MPVIGTGVEICTSTTRPNNPVVGTIIYETDTASYRWCTSLGPVVWTGMIPVGTVQSFAGTTAPPGWLFCFGQSLNATSNPQYVDLWGVLGTTYGGSGVTAFNLPDLRGRVAFGKDNMGGTATNRVTSGGSGISGTTIGATGGHEQLQSHLHNYGAVTTSGGSVNTNGDIIWAVSGGNVVDKAGTGYLKTSASGTNTGSGTGQNMPPAIILNYIIKFQGGD